MMTYSTGYIEEGETDNNTADDIEGLYHKDLSTMENDNASSPGDNDAVGVTDRQQGANNRVIE